MIPTTEVAVIVKASAISTIVAKMFAKFDINGTLVEESWKVDGRVLEGLEAGERLPHGRGGVLISFHIRGCVGLLCAITSNWENICKPLSLSVSGVTQELLKA